MNKRILIYQPIEPTFRVDEETELYFVDDYKEVFDETVDEEVYKGKSNNQILEELFCRFNCGNYPKEYKGHSLSVGDIVLLAIEDPNQMTYDWDENKEVPFAYEIKTYICCPMGWKEIDFTSQQAYMKAADAELFNQMNG